MKCPVCRSVETETLTRIDLIDSFPEGDLVVVQVACLDCGNIWTEDQLIPRPEVKVQ